MEVSVAQQPSHLERGKSNTQGLVVWLYGLSGSGKSTLASLLNERLKQEGHRTLMLDGDSLRATINSDLGFTDEDRRENIRRAAHIAQLSCQNDTIVIASFITPLERFRTLIREIVGSNQLFAVFLRCSYDTCASRDVKGLYAKAQKNAILSFTGKEHSRNIALGVLGAISRFYP
jgi:adenylylsulfate kinase